MPRGDGTGPGGLGPMTGRGAGFCAGYSTPGYMNPYGGRPGMGRGMGYGRGMGFGRGMGYGRGMGFGRGMGYGRGMGSGRGFYGYSNYGVAPYDPYYAGPPPQYAGGYSIPYNAGGTGTVSPQQELEMLKGQAEVLEDQMDGIKSRIQELGEEKKEK